MVLWKKKIKQAKQRNLANILYNTVSVLYCLLSDCEPDKLKYLIITLGKRPQTNIRLISEGVA